MISGYIFFKSGFMWKYLGAERLLAYEYTHQSAIQSYKWHLATQISIITILLCPLISIAFFFYHIKFSLSVIEHTYLCFFQLVWNTVMFNILSSLFRLILVNKKEIARINIISCLLFFFFLKWLVCSPRVQ
jgi:hypothetical protein